MSLPIGISPLSKTDPVGQLLLRKSRLFAQRVQPLAERDAFFLRVSAGLHARSHKMTNETRTLNGAE